MKANKRHLLIMWWFCLLFVSYRAYTQSTQIHPTKEFYRYYSLANKLMKQGDYKHAMSLYKFCLKNLPISEEEQLSLLRVIRVGTDIEQLYRDAEHYIRVGNRQREIDTYQAILRLNPSDPLASIGEKKATVTLKKENEWARWQNTADTFIKQGNFVRAGDILRLIPYAERSAQVQAKLKMILDVPARIAHIKELRLNGRFTIANEQEKKLKLDYPDLSTDTQTIYLSQNRFKEYNVLKIRAERYIAQCRYDLAETNYRKLRVDYPEYTAEIKPRLTFVLGLASRFRDLNSWQGDPSKREEVLRTYAYLYRRSKNCVINDYFNYTFSAGVIQMRNGSYERAIQSFIRSYAVSNLLANKNKVSQLILICNERIACFEKTRLFQKLLIEADQLYKQCLVDSSYKKYQQALPFNCKLEENKALIEVWERRKASLEENKLSVQRFLTLLSEADQLLDNGHCESAKVIYQQADSIRIPCIDLNKELVTKGILNCKECLKRQCFDSLIVKANHSKQIGFRRDELRFYKLALDCPAPAFRIQEIKRIIADLDCSLNRIGCPMSVSKLPDTLQVLYRPTLLFGVNNIAPVLYRQSMPLFIERRLGYSVGIRLERISFVKPLDFRVDLRYVNYSFNSVANNYVEQTFEFGNVEFSSGIKIHTVPSLRKKNQFRPYMHCSVGYTLPTSYRNHDYNKNQTYDAIEDRSNGFTTGRIGLGAEVQGTKLGLSLEAYYGSIGNDLFNQAPNRTIQNVDNYSIPKAGLVGIELGIRFW